MGEARSNQKPSTERKLGLVDRAKNYLKRKDTDKKVDKDTPKNFLDYMEKGDELLGTMLNQKEDDLDSEKGKEGQNRKKLALLQEQEYHLEKIAQLSIEYENLC